MDKKLAIFLFCCGFFFSSHSDSIYFKKYMQLVDPAFTNNDTSGFPAFRAFLDSLNYKEKYQAAADIHWELIDSVVMIKDWDEVEGILSTKYLGPYYYFWWNSTKNDSLFFSFMFGHASILDTTYGSVYFTYYSMQALIPEFLYDLVDKQADGEYIPTLNYALCKKSIDSNSTIIVSSSQYPDDFRRHFYRYDRFNDNELLNSKNISLKNDDLLKNYQLRYADFANGVTTVSGDTGRLFISNDFGASWRKSPDLPDSVWIAKAQFFNEKEGILLSEYKGRHNIMTTNDSGNSWKFDERFPNISCSDPLFEVLDTNRAFIVHRDSQYATKLYITKDKGATYTSYDLSFLNSVISNIFYLQPNHVLCFTEEADSLLIDFNLEKDTYSTHKMSLCGYISDHIYFIDSSNGFIGRSRGVLLKTENGGLNWKRIFIPFAGEIIKIHFFNNKDGVLIGMPFHFFITHDGGNTWALDDVYIKNCWAQNSTFISDRKCLVVKELAGIFYADFTNIVSVQPVIKKQKEAISVHPFSNRLVIKLPEQFFKIKDITVKIINISGREILKTKIDLRNQLKVDNTIVTSISTKSIAQGCYFLQIQGEKTNILSTFYIVR